MFELNCGVDVNKILTVECNSVGGIIDEEEVICIYNEGSGDREKC